MKIPADMPPITSTILYVIYYNRKVCITSKVEFDL